MQHGQKGFCHLRRGSGFPAEVLGQASLGQTQGSEIPAVKWGSAQPPSFSAGRGTVGPRGALAHADVTRGRDTGLPKASARSTSWACCTSCFFPPEQTFRPACDSPLWGPGRSLPTLHLALCWAKCVVKSAGKKQESKGWTERRENVGGDARRCPWLSLKVGQPAGDLRGQRRRGRQSNRNVGQAQSQGPCETWAHLPRPGPTPTAIQ